MHRKAMNKVPAKGITRSMTHAAITRASPESEDELEGQFQRLGKFCRDAFGGEICAYLSMVH